MKLRQSLLVIGLLAVAAAVVALDLTRFLSLEALRDSQARLVAWQAQAPLQVAALYFVVYVAATALSLPGATVITLAGGALFGLGWGTLIVSFASSLGATLAFLTARTLLRDAVRQRLGDRLAPIDAGVARDGAFYLFSLRLIPVVPFFVINLAMGLTAMRTWTFYWVSQLGMLAGTLVYVNAGTQLAQLTSLRDVLSPGVLGAFVLLGVFPLLARRVMALLQRRRVYRPWAGQRPRRFDRNLIVIGGGAGGLVTAYIAAAVKARVTLVEQHRLGGDCLNTGCVPSKALIRVARAAHQMRHASRFGLTDAEPGVRWPAVMARVREVIRAIEPHDSVERYTALGVDVALGRATLVNPWTVRIDHADGRQRTLTARSIVIAAGAAPVVPDLPGLAGVCLTSDTLWDRLAARAEAPRRVVVLGGGPIGCELAQALARLGVAVTVVEQAPRLLAREDADAAALVAQSLAADGVTVMTGWAAQRAEALGAGRVLVVARDGVEQRLEADELIVAVGRRARLSGYGLEALGIPTDRVVLTNDYLQTVFPHIYAAGDVAGPHQLTHAAAHQAWYAAVNALFGDIKSFKVDDRVMPRVTFTEPEVASVGLTEEQARERGVAVEVTRYGIDDLDRAIADGEAHGFVKVLTAPGKDRILGVTIVGAHAGELLAEYTLAMKHGLGLNRVLGTVHPYPTMAEANKYAAGEWKRAHAPQRLLAWVARFHTWRRGGDGNPARAAGSDAA